MKLLFLNGFILACLSFCVVNTQLLANEDKEQHSQSKKSRFFLFDSTGFSLSRDPGFEFTLLPMFRPHQPLLVGLTTGVHKSRKSHIELEAALDVTKGYKRWLLLGAAGGVLLSERGTVWTASATIFYVFSPYYRQYHIGRDIEREMGLKIKFPLTLLAILSQLKR